MRTLRDIHRSVRHRLGKNFSRAEEGSGKTKLAVLLLLFLTVLSASAVAGFQINNNLTGRVIAEPVEEATSEEDVTEEMEVSGSGEEKGEDREVEVDEEVDETQEEEGEDVIEEQDSKENETTDKEKNETEEVESPEPEENITEENETEENITVPDNITEENKTDDSPAEENETDEDEEDVVEIEAEFSAPEKMTRGEEATGFLEIENTGATEVEIIGVEIVDYEIKIAEDINCDTLGSGSRCEGEIKFEVPDEMSMGEIDIRLEIFYE